MKKLLLFLLIGCFVNLVLAQKVSLSGKAESYAGDSITFFTDKDFITKSPLVLGGSNVDSSGNFKINFETSETIQIYTNLGIYSATMFAEPGMNYEIVLPEKKEKTFAEKLNPYFQNLDVLLGVKNDSSRLNITIRRFDEIFEGYIDEYKFKLIQNSYTTNVDTFIWTIDSLFQVNNCKFFEDYKFYRFAQLRNMTYERNLKFVTKEYLLNKPVLYRNTAYTAFFNQLFNNYLEFYQNTKDGGRIYSDIIYAKSPSYAKQTLDNNISLDNDTLRELVLLKGLYDAFNNPDWPDKSLLQTLDSIITLSTVEEHKLIANNIKTKMTSLRKGYMAPDFNLYKSDGVLKSRDDYAGQYLYLNFCTSWSFECKKQYESLKKLLDTHNKYLNIVTICMDESVDKMKRFFKENNYKWDLLHYGSQEQIVSDYNIKVYPTYYFIDKDGELIMSPAPSPEDNFELHFIKLLRAQQNKEYKMNRN